MHRYADLRKKNQIAPAEYNGNLIVSNRRKRKPKKKDYPVGLWLMILFMFGISGLYIRYQALYVEDSVFRDTYVLINEHFLTKNPLPPIFPINSVNNLNPEKNISPKQNANNIQNKTTTIIPPQKKPQTIANVTPSQTITPIAPIENNSKVTDQIPKPNNPSLVANLTYYFPLLNSKNNKIGFFIFKKKTQYQEGAIYQTIFNNLVKYQNKNPKVKNFFDPKTKLISAWVENNTLLLNFNGAFENSKYGYKGIEIKIQQILWTFFEIKKTKRSISHISFLINGKRKNTIGGDGKSLKPFYSRKDLDSVISLRI